MSSTTSDAAAPTTTVGVEQWDLTSHVSPYLDRHMIFPLLEYLDTLIGKGSISYSSKDVAAARLSLLRPTHMVDYAIDVYKSLHGEAAGVPAEMQEQKETVYKELEALRQACAPLVELCNNQEQRAKLMGTGQWNVNSLLQSQQHNITEDMLENYRLLARYNFDCGDYSTARDMLSHYISFYANPPAKKSQGVDDDEEFLVTERYHQHPTKAESEAAGNPAIYYLNGCDYNMLQVLWGRLACEILVEDWEAASVAIDAVRAAMELLVQQQQMSALEALQQRTWLLHWSLFVYWNDKAGLEQLVDLFHSERYKQAITTNAPHLARYLTAAVLLCKRRVTKKAAAASNAEARRLMKNLTAVLQDCEYTDPIVEFVNCLSVKFDFDKAQEKLQECEKVLETDFFLCHQTALFMEEARIFVFENYCRIHNKIDLKAVGEKLAMPADQAEKWIVDLIRNADLDAKIDSEAGCVVMGGGGTASVYEQVMERTRDWNIRSATLCQNLTNLLKEGRKEKSKRERVSRDDY